MQIESEKQQNDGIQKLIDDVVSYGDLLLIANKGIGKTNSLMVLAQRFRNSADTKVILFEDFQGFLYSSSVSARFLFLGAN
jgi:hypothetical protein